MENSFQTSFIPKKPMIAGGSTAPVGENKTSITMVVTIFILVAIGLSAGGLFLYKSYLLKNKESLSANLFKIRDSFDKDTIAELELHDKRTTVAKQILSDHIVISPLFESINELTLSSIQYTKFSHQTSKDKTFSVKMSGIARDYRSIALQSDVFNTSKGKMFKDLIFSNLTKDKNNYVTFDVEFTVDPILLSYTNNISNKRPETNTDTTNTSLPSTYTETSVVPSGESFNTNVNPNPSLPATNNPQ